MESLTGVAPFIAAGAALLTLVATLYAIFSRLATRTDIDRVVEEMRQRTESIERKTEVINQRIDQTIASLYKEHLEHITHYHKNNDDTKEKGVSR